MSVDVCSLVRAANLARSHGAELGRMAYLGSNPPSRLWPLLNRRYREVAFLIISNGIPTASVDTCAERFLAPASAFECIEHAHACLDARPARQVVWQDNENTTHRI